MSSRFVSSGTTDNPVERDDEWLKAQQEIEANRLKKEEASRQEEGKTLYEVLQSNKAAKQEAFEESIKLKNQFRNLDEDEVEFLDSVLESTRAKEEAVRRETTEQLDLFRRQQEEADKALLGDSGDAGVVNEAGKASSPPVGEGQWAVNARKRKRVKEKEGLKGVKLRKSSTHEQQAEVNTTLSQPSPGNSGNAETKLKERNTLPVSLAANPSTAATESKQDTSTLSSSGNKTTRVGAEAKQGGFSGLAKVSSSPRKGSSPNQGVASGIVLAGYSSDEED